MTTPLKESQNSEGASPGPVRSGDGLGKLRTLLGDDVFFVPCEWGTKKPVVTYVERPFEGTKSPAYRALFEGEPRNIAVYLGVAFGGLCAIDFDVEEDLTAFLAANPKLARTTRTRGSRGGMVWVRIEVGGDAAEQKPEIDQSILKSSATGKELLAVARSRDAYPPSCTTPHFEWRADKRLSTIAGRHPKGMDYVFIVEAPPVRLRFDEIVWPEGWELPWQLTPVQLLERKFGPGFNDLSLESLCTSTMCSTMISQTGFTGTPRRPGCGRT